MAFTDIDAMPGERWLRTDRIASRTRGGYLAGGITMPVGRKPSIAALVDATTYLDQELYVELGYAAGANSGSPLGRRRVGGLNEQLANYGGDDETSGWRLKAAGVRLDYAPEVRLTHPPRERLRDIAGKAYRGGLSYAARRRIATGSESGTRPIFRGAGVPAPRAVAPTPRWLGSISGRRCSSLCGRASLAPVRPLATIVGDYVGERRWRARSAAVLDPTLHGA